MPKSPISNNRALILSTAKDPSNLQILLEQVDDSKWSIPYTRTEGERFYYSTNKFNEQLQETFSLNVTTLRCLDNVEDPETGEEFNTYLVECHGYTELPANLKWHPLSSLESNNSISSQDIETISQAVVWLKQDNSLRVPWSRLGWFDEIKGKFIEHIEELGFSRPTSIEQVRTWERSSVLRAKTEDVYLYLKSVPDMFAYEPAVAYWLGKQFPAYVAPVLGHYFDTNLGHYMIMPHYDGRWLDQVQELRHWEEVIIGYATLQKSLIDHLPQISAFGVITRHVEKLFEDTVRMFADVELLQTGNKPLSYFEIQSLQKSLPTIERACEQIVEFHIPLTLDHGDFWSGQVVIQDNDQKMSFLINDWSDCSITHPFFSVPFFLEDAEVELPGYPNAREYLWATYAKQWSDFEDEPALSKIVQLAQLLGPVHNAVVYHNYILPRMELPWEMQFMYLRHLRKILLALENLDS